MSRFSILAAAVATALVGVAVPASAEATSSDVYQVVDNIQRELDLILNTVGKEAKHDTGAPAIPERQPRHVIQEARALLERIEEIHGHHGMEEIEIPPFPVREVTPEDVKQLVELALEEIRELRPALGVTATPEPAPLTPGMGATEVYGLLHEVSLQMDSLGETHIAPYHVYLTAMAVVHEMDNIWDHTGHGGAVHLESHHGMGDQEVYDQAYGLLEDVQRLSQMDGFAVPGGVVLLERRAGDITNADIMELLTAAMAELAAVKVAVGSSEAVEFAMPDHTDKLPTNAYDAIYLARSMVGGLLGS